MNIKTIEEKAKAYDEALNWMRELYPGLHGATKEDAEHYFPELRESEDERIRNEIIAFIKQALHSGGGISVPKEKEDRWLAYLEKQKDHFRDDTKMVEQKPAEKETTLNGFEKALDSFLFDFAHSSITDCEPKEYIKNHSAYLIKAAYKELNAQLKQDLFEAQQEGRREGYEAAKNELKPTEWSEEDEKKIHFLSRLIEFQVKDDEYCFGDGSLISKQEAIEMLKSLRPQSHWKPSEEDIKMLEHIIGQYETGNKNSNVMGYLPRVEELNFLKKVLSKWKN